MFKNWWTSFKSGKPREYPLRIPRAMEKQGTLLFGDSGSGKSQFIHRIINQVRVGDRQEPGVCYDPAAEFVKAHFREGLDLILNPLDERFPNWELASEIRTLSDLDLVAESFIPTLDIKNEQAKFFKEAAQDVFKLILAQRWTIRKMISVLCSEDEIDKLAEGTEVAFKISAKSGPQRIGVLATLADVGKVLRLVPPSSKETKRFSLTAWAKDPGKSWLFLTATKETQNTLRPFIAAMLNILMSRMLSVSPSGRKTDSIWFLADEIHNLHCLPMLPEFMVECRKYGICYVLGTQSKYQLIQYYDERVRAMIASPYLKVFFRCNEPEAAKWISDCLGNQEREKTAVTVSLPNGEGHETTNFSTVTVNRPIASKEQIMKMINMRGYWNFETVVVPFEFEIIEWQPVNTDFIPRPMSFGKPPTAQNKNNPPQPPIKKANSPSIQPENEISLDF